MFFALKKSLTQSLALLLACALFSASFISEARAQNSADDSTATTIAPADLTLPLAVEIALRTNPLMRATSAGREIADAQLGEARAGRLPVLQFNETLTRSNNPVFVFGSLLEQGKFTAQNFDLKSLNNPDALNNFRTSLTLKLPLFDQRQTTTRIAQAQIRQQQADTQTSQAQQQLRFEVLRAYYGVLLAQTKKAVADEATKTAEADVKRIRDLVEVGMVVTSDLLSAEVQLADFRQQQIQAEGDIAIAYAALNTALGMPINTSQKITGQLVEKNFAVAQADELIRQALENRPDYTRASLSVRASEEQTRGAKSENLPRVDLFANFGASNKSFAKGSSDYLVGASVTFNLFDAGRKNRINQADAARALANAEKDQLAGQIRFEVVRAHQQFVSARERLTVASRVIDRAQEALRIVQARHREGLTNITEVLQAETALVRARLNLVAARYEHYVGYANVLLASGKLTDVQEFVG
ncbi:MAG: TolC family protein [Acidobacteriota bacterium]